MLRLPFHTWLATLMATLALPGSAAAGTVRTEYGASPSSGPGWHLVFSAAPGEANHIDSSAMGRAVVIHDAGAAVVAGVGCTQLAPGEASCATPDGTAFTDATADLGDGDDTPSSRGALSVCGSSAAAGGTTCSITPVSVIASGAALAGIS
jgi:hypothetical protein